MSNRDGDGDGDEAQWSDKHGDLQWKHSRLSLVRQRGIGGDYKSARWNQSAEPRTLARRTWARLERSIATLMRTQGGEESMA